MHSSRQIGRGVVDRRYVWNQSDAKWQAEAIDIHGIIIGASQSPKLLHETGSKVLARKRRRTSVSESLLL